MSNIESFAEVIDHWINYTSTTFHDINIDAGLQIPHVGISGHFSSDYQHVKSRQINDHSVTTRVQLRYIRYKATLQPDSPLHPRFKQRLLGIAASLELNKTALARYQSQILIRDFGTHVISSVDAGAALIQKDQLNSEFMKKYADSRSKVSETASLSFFVRLNASYTSQDSQQMVDEYLNSRTTSKLFSYGGPLFRAGNYSANDWTSFVDKELVAIDRSGDPLSFLITPTILPELPIATLNDLQKNVAEAIELYYEYNTHRGCTDMLSPNFNPLANFDDGSCEARLTNMTFGGVYQTCSQTTGSNDGDVCSELKLNQVNPKTGGYSCSAHFQTVELHTTSISRSRSESNCETCWLFFKCCHTDYYHSGATYTMYWCAANGSVPQDSGYLFGGFYTEHVKNYLTGAQTCPEHFYARQLSTSLFICISDDFELGTKYSLPFAGFLSCKIGNPLALKRNASSLASFYRISGPSAWPKHCPQGFSKHLAYSDQGCAINYCVKSGFVSESGLPLPLVRRPPFVSQPAREGLPDNYIIFDPITNTWIKNTAAVEYQQERGDSDPSYRREGLTTGATAGISVGVTLVCVILATVVVALFRRRMGNRKYTRSTEEREDSPIVQIHS